MNKLVLAAGPILRRVTEQEIVIWIALDKEQALLATLSTDFSDQEQQIECKCNIDKLRVSKNLWVYLVRLTPSRNAFETKKIVYYDILARASESENEQSPSLVKGKRFAYGSAEFPSFVIDKIAPLLTGSCRKPHTKKIDDFMAKMSVVLDRTWDDERNRPKALFLTGDQIYADDVSWVLSKACQLLAAHLCGNNYKEYLPDFDEEQEYALVLSELNSKRNPYYRHQLFVNAWNREDYMEKCGFTSSATKNHLVLFCEFVAMYLLVWSKWGWDKIKSELDFRPLYNFVDGLEDVARLLANVPTYMIFDDHDVTDDWNINLHWKANLKAPGKKVVGNALTAYWIFQAWGNTPETFDHTGIKEHVAEYCDGLTAQYHSYQLSPILDYLRDQHQPWWYTLEADTTEVVVFDIRTRRHKGEKENSISGLMEPEYLKEIFSGCKIGTEVLIIISPSPIFGFSKIEELQGLLSFWNSSVTFADRENWSGDGIHVGPKQTYDELLNQLFRLKPKQLIIISGDVHYGYVKRGLLKDQLKEKVLDNVCQITSSALQNQPALSFLSKPLLKSEKLWYDPTYHTDKPNLVKSDKDYILFYRTNFGLIDYRKEQQVSLYTLDSDDEISKHLF